MRKQNEKRWNMLIKIIQLQEYKVGAEIGVKSGVNLHHLLARCPDLYMYAVDPWYPTEAYSDWPDRHHKIHEEKVDRIIAHFPGRVRKMKMLSQEAASLVKDGSLDFVFIDGDHTYEGVKIDLNCWIPKVRTGGCVAGHDYNHTFPGVDKAVNEVFGEEIETGPDHTWWTLV